MTVWYAIKLRNKKKAKKILFECLLGIYFSSELLPLSSTLSRIHQLYQALSSGNLEECTSSLPFLTGPLWPGMVVPVNAPCMGRKELRAKTKQQNKMIILKQIYCIQATWGSPIKIHKYSECVP